MKFSISKNAKSYIKFLSPSLCLSCMYISISSKIMASVLLTRDTTRYRNQFIIVIYAQLVGFFCAFTHTAAIKYLAAFKFNGGEGEERERERGKEGTEDACHKCGKSGMHLSTILVPLSPGIPYGISRSVDDDDERAGGGRRKEGE